MFVKRIPRGVGTVEEILYLLAILMHPENKVAIPLVLTGPEPCRAYFEELQHFLVQCLGEEVREHCRVREATDGVQVRRRDSLQAYYFNWALQIAPELQAPFVPDHAGMAALELRASLPKHELAGNLRCAFSGLVAGNVKAFGIQEVQRHGPYKLTGDRQVVAALDRLLQMLARENRMKLGGEQYRPCYQLED